MNHEKCYHLAPLYDHNSSPYLFAVVAVVAAVVAAASVCTVKQAKSAAKHAHFALHQALYDRHHIGLVRCLHARPLPHPRCHLLLRGHAGSAMSTSTVN